MTLSSSIDRHELALERPFTISRGTIDTADVLVVRIEDEEGTVGVGGAGPSARLGETAATVEAVLPELFDAVESVGDPHAFDRIERLMVERIDGNPAARCAISIALYDLVGKRLDLPLYRYWGLDPDESVPTSYTLGIDDPETVREKTEEAVDAGYSILKVKLGTDRDRDIVATVREVAPDATIRADANEGWTPREAVRKIDLLAGYDVEFVEQPVPAEDPEGLAFVYDRSPIPIAADESCVTLSDVPRIADRTDIANIKLMKCGGLGEARRMIHAARAHGLRVMVGCMTESNASIAAGAHLTPLADYADLDGSLLLRDDPYEGVPMAGGEIDLGAVEGAGTGVRRSK